MDIYAEVTSRILAQMEQGIIPWDKPWTGVCGGAISHESGRPYSLINQILLGGDGEYITFNQCKKEGGAVKKGSKAKMVVFWKIYRTDKKDADGKLVRDTEGMPVPKTTPVLRYYNVFHIDDCDGITPRIQPDAPSDVQPVAEAENVFAAYVQRSGVQFQSRRQDSAYYSPSRDAIVLPLMEQFDSAEGYYDTAFHEAVHSTGHKSRLNRFDESAKIAAFGSADYSKEELVAEIGSATLMHTLQMETPKTLRNSAAYIQCWMRALQNDRTLLVSATSRAEKAVNVILGVA